MTVINSSGLTTSLFAFQKTILVFGADDKLPNIVQSPSFHPVTVANKYDFHLQSGYFQSKYHFRIKLHKSCHDCKEFLILLF